MQLVGRPGQDPLSIPLCGIAAFPAVPAQLFQFVVQVFNRVFSFLVSVSELLAAWATQDSLSRIRSWGTTPVMTCMGLSQGRTGCLLSETDPCTGQSARSGRYLSMGIPSFEVMWIRSTRLK